MAVYSWASLVATTSTTSGWYVTPPTSARDWRQVAELITDSFDVDLSSNHQRNHWAWKLWQRELAIQANYQHYVQTARRMKGTKYAIWTAKQENRLVGVVEIGLTAVSKRPTLGSLCVAADCRDLGIGRALITRCEELVASMWNETSIHAEVRPQNTGALEFFHACGYERIGDTSVVVQKRGQRNVEPHQLLRKTLKVGSVLASRPRSDENQPRVFRWS